jgi:hypothetical protein
MMSMSEQEYSCPSSQPTVEGAQIFGIIGGTVDRPHASYLKKGVEVTPDLIEQVGDIDPKRVFRFSGQCMNSACGQFRNGQCRLGQDIVRMLKPVVEQLPACTIRATCRWYAENGRDACLRCPQVVTTTTQLDHELQAVVRAVEMQPRAE